MKSGEGQVAQMSRSLLPGCHVLGISSRPDKLRLRDGFGQLKEHLHPAPRIKVTGADNGQRFSQTKLTAGSLWGRQIFKTFRFDPVGCQNDVVRREGVFHIVHPRHFAEHE